MARRFLFWLMLPLSGVQGLWLRRVATRLPGAAGEREGAVGNGAVLRFLALGDSIIDGVGVEQISEALPVQFARELSARTGRRVEWRVEGESGLDIQGVITKARSLSDVIQPELLLISVGVNDVTGLSSTRHWRHKLNELLEILQGQWPGIRVVFAGLPPMEKFPLPPQPLRQTLGWRAAALDRVATEVVSAYPNAVHFPTRMNPSEHDFCADGFHPSAVSCTLWARELAELESRSHPE